MTTPNQENPLDNPGNPPVDSGASNDPQNPPAGGSGDTLTKEQADALVKARIDKQNAKHAKETEALTQQLADEQSTREELEKEVATLRHEKELAAWKEQASAETGVPASVLKGDTLEELQAHAAQIKAAIPMYPTLPNDGGASNTPALTKEDIYAIKDRRKRVEAMAQHDELF